MPEELCLSKNKIDEAPDLEGIHLRMPKELISVIDRPQYFIFIDFHLFKSVPQLYHSIGVLP